MTVDVLRSVKKAGFAPFNLIALSDHRGLFFDLDIAMVFDEKLKDLEPAKFRKLQSSHLKRVKEYHKLLTEEWTTHKIDTRLQTLSDDFKKDGPTSENVKRLNDLDQHITDIMRYSEKNCTTISRHAKDPWSPKLKELAREIRYLVMEIKNCIRDKLPISLVDCMERITSLHLRLNRKRKEYREFLKSAKAHRELHLDERAQYHVDIGKNKKKGSEIKRLKNIEQQKNDSIKIQFTINEISKGSATYILIPHLKEYEQIQDFDGNIYSVRNIWDRVQLRGGEDIEHWVRITDKSMLEDMLIQWQILHYTQANNTPFSDQFWTKELEKDEVSDKIINGTYTPPDELPWEAKEILLHMKRSSKIEKEICTDTSFDDFRKFYRLATESTSSSPSGRHYGHFKALLQTDEKYMSAIHDILCIAVEHDIILHRWKPTISTLIEKIQGKPYIHKYRTIHIIESDIQFLSKQIYVLGMMKLADSLGLITDQQYGARNKRQCQSAYINKICYYDLSRQKLMSSAFLDDDAKACYDRIVTGLSEVEVRKWGVSKKASKFTTKFLHNQQFYLKLASGTTKQSYQYTETTRIQGSGQGIGWAGPRWTASSDTISNIMSEKCTGMKYTDPTNKLEIKRNGDFFVDDLDIGVTEDAIGDKTKNTRICLQEDEQIHSLILNGIGHCLNPIKCSWYDIHYKREGLGHVPMTIDENPGELEIQVEFGQEKKRIKRLEPHVATKALGIFLAPNGKYKKQYKELDKKIRRWARNVKSSSLTHRERIVAYHGYILRGILYVLSATNFTKEQCDKLQQTISPILYNAFRIHRNAARTPLYTPKSLGGFGVISIYHLQGIEKIKYYLMHRRINDTTGQLLTIGNRYTQFELGTSTPFWKLKYNRYKHFITDTWITNIWSYLDSCGMSIVEFDYWKYVLPRRHDFFLMDAVFESNLSVQQIQMFNQMRLYMKIISVSDLMDEETGVLKSNIMGCSKPLTSTYGFPNIKPFPSRWIPLWDSIISSIILPRVQSIPLGPRISHSHLDISPVYEEKQNANFETIVPLNEKELVITSPKFCRAVNAIQKNLRLSPRWKRHIWGASRFTHKSLYNIIKLAATKQLAIATDASVDKGYAAHAFCFASRKKGKVVFSSGSKVEGPGRHLTSYRAEMTSIIAATELIDTILSTVGMAKCHIPLYTDSETSIVTSKNTRLNTLRYVISNDIDMALQLHSSISNCKQRVSLIHVLGHQDKTKKFHELNVPAQLNVLMDGLSKKLVIDTKTKTNKIIPFPAQKFFLCSNQPIAHDVQNVLIAREMKGEIGTFYEKHHSIPKSVLEGIDWEANRMATTTRHELSYRKTLHNFRNTMEINHKWKRIDTDVCPLCSKKTETIQHLLECDQQDLQQLRWNLLKKMEETWKKVNTNKYIVQQWKEIFTSLQNDDDMKIPTINMNPTTWSVVQAFQHQNQIGWRGFTNGLLSVKWSDIQQKHYEANPTDGENIHRWRRVIVQSFLDLLRQLWRMRCGFINAESVLTERDMLSKRTHQLFNDNEHLREMLPLFDRHLLDKQESYFRTSSRETLVLWENRLKKSLKTVNVRDNNQPQINFERTVRNMNVADNKEVRQNMLITNGMVRLTNFITNAKRLRARRPISNIDSSWNKRLKLTHKLQRLKKRKRPQQKTRPRTKRKYHENTEFKQDIPEIVPQCFILRINSNSSVRS